MASLVLIAITITFSATMILAMNMFSNKVNVRSQDAYNKILEIDNVVRQKFFDAVDEDFLYNNLIKGYMQGLKDADSVYLTASEIAAREQRARGTIVSVGLELTKNSSDGYFTVTKIYTGSPADKGLQAGDVIRKINGQDLLALSIEEVQPMISGGVVGEKITLEYVRDSKPSETELAFDSIEATAVEGKQIDDVFYIRVTALWNTAPRQFRNALSAAKSHLENQGVKGMVIDLRGVTEGNNLGVVEEMLGMLMPVGTTIVGIYRDGERILGTANGDEFEIPFVVLINQNTQGYAELLAEVLQSSPSFRNLVGVKTAGKGTYRELTLFSDGSGIELSVALLKAPGGSPYHGVGIVPISEVKMPEDYVIAGDPVVGVDYQFTRAVDVLRLNG